MPYLFDILGWVGMVTLVVAYLQVSRGKWNPKGLTFQWLNLFGAMFVGINAALNAAWPAAALQTVWAIIAAATLFMIFHKKS